MIVGAEGVSSVALPGLVRVAPRVSVASGTRTFVEAIPEDVPKTTDQSAQPPGTDRGRRYISALTDG